MKAVQFVCYVVSVSACGCCAVVVVCVAWWPGSAPLFVRLCSRLMMVAMSDFIPVMSVWSWFMWDCSCCCVSLMSVVSGCSSAGCCSPAFGASSSLALLGSLLDFFPLILGMVVLPCSVLVSSTSCNSYSRCDRLLFENQRLDPPFLVGMS